MKNVITGVSLRPEHHLLLREAARAVQAKQGGRVSASAIITDLIERHREELTEITKENSSYATD